MFESNVDVHPSANKELSIECEMEKNEAIESALARASVLQFAYVFICAVIVTRFLKVSVDIGGVIAFLIAFVCFTPYFAFMVRGVFQKKNTH